MRHSSSSNAKYLISRFVILFVHARSRLCLAFMTRSFLICRLHSDFIKFQTYIASSLSAGSFEEVGIRHDWYDWQMRSHSRLHLRSAFNGKANVHPARRVPELDNFKLKSRHRIRATILRSRKGRTPLAPNLARYSLARPLRSSTRAFLRHGSFFLTFSSPSPPLSPNVHRVKGEHPLFQRLFRRKQMTGRIKMMAKTGGFLR